MKSGDLLKLAIVGVGGYLLYNYLVQSGMWAQWFGGAGGMLPAGGGVNPGTTTIPGSTFIPSSGQALPAAQPRMNVTTSSGNPAAMKVGDSYTVSITGAQPNARVMVTATQGATTIQDATGQAFTDANGNFSISGVAENAHLGAWSEVWRVGNVVIGNWNFTISPSGVSGVGAIIPVPNNGPIRAEIPGMSFNNSGFKGGGYGSSYPSRGKQGNSWVQ